MIERLARNGKGYVRIELWGYSPERFLNLCRKKGRPARARMDSLTPALRTRGLICRKSRSSMQHSYLPSALQRMSHISISLALHKFKKRSGEYPQSSIRTYPFPFRASLSINRTPPPGHTYAPGAYSKASEWMRPVTIISSAVYRSMRSASP